MKINDIKTTQAELQRVANDANPVKDSAAAEKAATAAGPAASVKITNPAVLASAQVLAASGDMSDVKLLDQIRDRIANGSFEIDYGKLARSMLADSMAANGNKGGNTNA